MSVTHAFARVAPALRWDPQVGSRANAWVTDIGSARVRCQVDESRAWRMVCGRCWRDAGRGQADGRGGGGARRARGARMIRKIGIQEAQVGVRRKVLCTVQMLLHRRPEGDGGG